MRNHLTRTAGLAVAVAALAAPSALAATHQDLRSPDAIDAAAGRGTSTAPQITVVQVPGPASPSRGIDWADTGIGAGGVLGVVLLAGGGTALLVRRPRRGAIA
jgi:hypothetical protein